MKKKLYVLSLITTWDEFPMLAHCSVHNSYEEWQGKMYELIEGYKKKGVELGIGDFDLTEQAIEIPSPDDDYKLMEFKDGKEELEKMKKNVYDMVENEDYEGIKQLVDEAFWLGNARTKRC